MSQVKLAGNADCSALARIGASVRTRLERDPAIYRLPTEGAAIWGCADFLTPGECARLCAMIDAVAEPSQTFDQAQQSVYRTSFSGDVDRNDPFVAMIERRIDDLLGLDSRLGETVQGQRYQPGQQFHAHYDWFEADSPYWPEQRRRGGQRSITAMIYLNEVEAGGYTEFPRLGLSVPPQSGVLIAWNNAQPDGAPNRDTLHAARPVERGVKYVVTKWYRVRDWS